MLIKTLGIPCGYFYWRWQGARRYVPGLLGFALAVFMLFAGYGMWLHKLNFGTFTGKINPISLPVRFEAVTEAGEVVSGDEFAGKITLLDFWHTSCGICFEKFPRVQTVSERYRDDHSVSILAVDKPLEEDKPGQAFDMIRAEGYTFDVVVARDEGMPEKFGVYGYPTTFVIDRKGEIVFKGDIEGAVKMVDELKHAE